MATLLVRPFEPARDDYDALAALWTSQHPDLPRMASVWRERDAKPKPDALTPGRLIALDGETLVGMAEWEGCQMSGEPGQLQVAFVTAGEREADPILEALYGELWAGIEPLDSPVLLSYVRDTHPWMIAFYERHGFEEAQRTASSELLTNTLDDELVAATPARLRTLGYELLSVAALVAEDGDWRVPYYELETAVIADIPFLGPIHAEPFERFAARVADPLQFNPEAVFVARQIATGELAALCQLLTWEAKPDYAFAGLTGSTRAHRRRGLARALKQATLRYALEHGIERIVALNEVDNPMLLLNHELGFQTQHIQLTMRWTRDGSTPAAFPVPSREDD